MKVEERFDAGAECVELWSITADNVYIVLDPTGNRFKIESFRRMWCADGYSGRGYGCGRRRRFRDYGYHEAIHDLWTDEIHQTKREGLQDLNQPANLTNKKHDHEMRAKNLPFLQRLWLVPNGNTRRGTKCKASTQQDGIQAIIKHQERKQIGVNEQDPSMEQNLNLDETDVCT